MKLAEEVKKILKEEGLGPISPELMFKLYDILVKDFPEIKEQHPIKTEFYHYITGKLKGM